jgi:8-amino-7-oxononanoate synthase
MSHCQGPGGELSAEERRKLLSELIRKKGVANQPSKAAGQGPAPMLNPTLSEGQRELARQQEWLRGLGEENPFFRPMEGSTGPTAVVDGRETINYGSYNYLGLSGHPRVNEAAKRAIESMGTSVGASRIASGERELHRRLEQKMASLFGVEDALVMVGGYGTNQTVIGHLVGPQDLILHDSLMHRSGIDGGLLSGARRMAFPHNDLTALERTLTEQRENFRQCLVVVEGLYSMDGDSAFLPRLVELKRSFGAMLFVDEAHSMGVMGATGRGVGEHYGVEAQDVDFWMTTLSKTFASCGGVVAGQGDIMEYLRYTAPGFIYSVGVSPANTAAALEAANILEEEPQRVASLQANARLFHTLCQEAGLNTGSCEGFAVIPVITGSSEEALRLSNALFRRGINVQPVLYPAVPETEARLRFFLTSEHSEDQIRSSVSALSELSG